MAFVLVMVSVSPVFAQITILPKAADTVDCSKTLQDFELSGTIPAQKKLSAEAAKAKADNDYAGVADPMLDVDCGSANPPVNPKACADLNKAKDNVASANAENDSSKDAKATSDDRANLLGCAIKTGRVSLQMIPYFITYFSNFLLSLVGIIAVLFIVIGGYQYIRGGLTENKDKGKKTISHALMGMVVAILAWVIVNLVMGALTS